MSLFIRVAKHTGKMSAETPRRQQVRKSLAQYRRGTSNRNTAIAATYVSGAYTLKAIGKHFGLHYATVRRIAVTANFAKQDLTR